MDTLDKVIAPMKDHMKLVAALLLVLLIIVVYLVYTANKQGMSMMPFDAVGPTVTNYNQTQDQVAVGDTVQLNVDETGAQILSDPNFGCATNVPWSGDDAWAWQVSQAESDVAANNAAATAAATAASTTAAAAGATPAAATAAGNAAGTAVVQTMKAHRGGQHFRPKNSFAPGLHFRPKNSFAPGLHFKMKPRHQGLATAWTGTAGGGGSPSQFSAAMMGGRAF
jgi:hypothetical protein